MKLGAKVDAEPVIVCHAELKRFSTESPYRSVCPVCNIGVLLVGRSQKTFRLINVDRCTFCGQLVIYSDAIIAGEPVVDATHPRPTSWDRVLVSEKPS